MNYIFSAVTGFGALGVAAMVSLTADENDLNGISKQEPVQEIIVSREDADTWILSQDNSGDLCLITKTRNLTAGSFAVELDATCSDIFDQVNNIETWQQDKFGNVILADATGSKVLEFMISEELALQSIFPNNERLSLSPNG